MTPRRLFIRTLSPAIWRAWPRRQIAALQEFAAIEKDSGCQLLHCHNRIKNERLKAHLFQHVLEEFYHGELFSSAAKALSDRHVYETFPPREELSTGEGEGEGEGLRDFFAYVQVGERAVNRDFEVYSRTRLDPKVKAVFAKAGMDEGRHEDDTGDILLGLCGSNRRQLRLVLWKAELRRLWNLYKRSVQSIGSISLTMVLTVVYFFIGALAVPTLRRRLRISRKAELEIFREQVVDFEAEQRSEQA